MTLTATFSNGHQDTYKGQRDVKAAWMITEAATGKVLNSGHSKDRESARKTAEGNVTHAAVHLTDLPGFHLPRSTRDLNTGWARQILKQLREAGGLAPEHISLDTVFQAAKEANQRLAADKRSKVNIEIIDL